LCNFNPAWDPTDSLVDPMPVVTDFLPNGSYEHDVLNVHLTGFVKANRQFSFTQCRKGRKDPVLYAVLAREKELFACVWRIDRLQSQPAY
jgi:hypothetical protein